MIIECNDRCKMKVVVQKKKFFFLMKLYGIKHIRKKEVANIHNHTDEGKRRRERKETIQFDDAVKKALALIDTTCICHDL